MSLLQFKPFENPAHERDSHYKSMSKHTQMKYIGELATIAERKIRLLSQSSLLSSLINGMLARFWSISKVNTAMKLNTE